ncbi:DUF6861 domain-containing protein [Pseudomonas laurylsulfatiphila]|uniref:DUF6861 domain-containing protein n=1 Tax=Pseudomonas laurylsulfatiphila TaxID=2011015 RepID=UPI003D1C158A
MDLLANVPSWADVERNLDQKFNELNQGVNDGLQSVHDNWNGFTRRVSNGASQAYGYMGGRRIDAVHQAMTLSYPIIQMDLKRKWASIEIEQILPVLLQLVKEVSMILGGSVAIGTVAGGAAGAFAFGVGAGPGAMVGGGIGLQVGNLILMALGLSAIAEYFYQGLPACLSTLQEGIATAWHAEEGLKPSGLDPSGGSAALVQERIERAARQLARGQEQLVLLLLTAIVTYLTRGQMKAGVMNSMESIATRSAKLQAEISNKQLAGWLAKNEQKLLARDELRVKEPAPLVKAEDTFKYAEPAQSKNNLIQKIDKPTHPQHATLPGKIVGEFDMINNPGPLAELRGSPSGNFSGGRYKAIELSDDITLFRGGDINGKALGQWFTEKAPESVAQVRIDTAVKPQWIDPLTGELTGTSPVNSVFTIKIPAGTMVYEGPVGNQGGIFVGGPNINQIFVQEPWKVPGVEIIGNPTPIK